MAKDFAWFSNPYFSKRGIRRRIRAPRNYLVPPCSSSLQFDRYLLLRYNSLRSSRSSSLRRCREFILFTSTGWLQRILFYNSVLCRRSFRYAPKFSVILCHSVGGIRSCRFERRDESRGEMWIDKPIYFCDVLKNTRLPIYIYIYYKKGSSCFQNSSTRSESRGSTTTRRTRRRRCCPRATRILLILVSVLDRTN